VTLHRALLGIDLAAAAVAVAFFLWGLADGTALYAPGAWVILLGGIAVIIGGGVALGRRGHAALANTLLLVLAIPALGYALFILMVLVLQPRWN
jgi:hypothetical protein